MWLNVWELSSGQDCRKWSPGRCLGSVRPTRSCLAAASSTKLGAMARRGVSKSQWWCGQVRFIWCLLHRAEPIPLANALNAVRKIARGIVPWWKPLLRSFLTKTLLPFTLPEPIIAFRRRWRSGTRQCHTLSWTTRWSLRKTREWPS